MTHLRALLLTLVLLPAATEALAIPSFAQQTGEACEACHVGAFGPQLKPFGRDFKLYGYVSADAEQHLPRVALTVQSGFTRTGADQPENAAIGLQPNNNTLLDQQISAYYGGAVTSHLGAFVQTTYDGQAHQFMLDNTDIRYARLLKLSGKDLVLGITVNNSPTVQDLWNSSPAWGFPYNGSSVANAPAAAALLDGGLGLQVLGAGAYAMWNDWIFAEATAYQGLSGRARNALGSGPQQGAPQDVYDGLLPYWRLAVQHELGDHYFQVGTYGLLADRFPAGDRSSGKLDRIRDRALDANYQYTGSPEHFLSFHATYLQEDLSLGASQPLSGTGANGTLRTARADLSYSYRNTWTPSIQFFETSGSTDAALWGTATGSPNSRGYVAELAYVPLGKTGSALPWFNLRLSLQYIGYQRFDGSSAGASNRNTVYLSLWTAFAPFYAFEPRH